VQYFCKAALREEHGLTHKNQQERIASFQSRIGYKNTIAIGETDKGHFVLSGLHHHESNRSQSRTANISGK
jgi:hypothetical protein